MTSISSANSPAQLTQRFLTAMQDQTPATTTLADARQIPVALLPAAQPQVAPQPPATPIPPANGGVNTPDKTGTPAASGNIQFGAVQSSVQQFNDTSREVASAPRSRDTVGDAVSFFNNASRQITG